MAQIPRDTIESGLRQKGFVKSNSEHRLYHFSLNGRLTHIRTMISHGSKYKVYGDILLGLMKIQLKLDTVPQLRDLVTCPLSTEGYIEILRRKGEL